jgi:tRNA threonylcarbamoyladenosine biosynthesis protein TsaB
MRVLAVDTSTMAGGVALLDGERVVGESLLDVRTTHSERLMVAIDRVLADAGWAPADVDGLAVAVGPGSFTGLRIGLAAVKGLALALDRPIAAVPTLDAMAAALPWSARPVCPVLDARKNEVYASLYRWDGLAMQREWDHLALSPDALAARLHEPVIGVGDGAALIRSPWLTPAQPVRRGPPAAVVAWLGADRLRAGDVVPAAELVPLYLRPSEAELKHRRAVALH